MSTILLAAPPDLDVSPLVGALEPYGLTCPTVELRPGLGELPVEANEPSHAFLILRQQRGVVDVGERASQLRRLLPADVDLTVCTHRLTSADREVIHGCGVSKVITPGDWKHSSVAERIAAELIWGGTIGPPSFGRFRGSTLAMRRIYREIEQIAPFLTPVLILGETGTGKELAAREIHERSRRGGKFVPFNVADLTPDLISSELSGHERGAFTGSTGKRKGLLMEAGKGTVFFDEIGDLDPGSQAKLLRILEEREVRPVGSNQMYKIEARFIFATHCDLAAESEASHFRSDLYQRIHGVSLSLPPLREHRADIPLLAQHFLDQFNDVNGGKRFIPPGAVDPLFRYSFPGNVRELRNAIEAAAIFAGREDAPINSARLREKTVGQDSAQNEAHDAKLHSDDDGNFVRFDPGADSWQDVQNRAQVQYFRSLLKRYKGRKSEAIERSGYSRTQFYEIVNNLEEEADEE